MDPMVNVEVLMFMIGEREVRIKMLEEQHRLDEKKIDYLDQMRLELATKLEQVTKNG